MMLYLLLLCYMYILTVQIDQYCEKHELTIMGYYQANELVESSRYDKLHKFKQYCTYITSDVTCVVI